MRTKAAVDATAKEAVRGGRLRPPPGMSPEQHDLWAGATEKHKQELAEETPEAKEERHGLTGPVELGPAKAAARMAGEMALGMNPATSIPLDSYYMKEAIEEGGFGDVALAGAAFVPLVGEVRKLAKATKAGKAATSSAEATARQAKAAAKAWRELGTESPYFKRWSGGAPIVQPEDAIPDGPVVIRAWHGNTIEGHKLKSFAGDRPIGIDQRGGGTQSAGRGIYATRSKEDALEYAGENAAEVYPVFLRMDSPLNLTKKMKDVSPEELSRLSSIVEEIGDRQIALAKAFDESPAGKERLAQLIETSGDPSIAQKSSMEANQRRFWGEDLESINSGKAPTHMIGLGTDPGEVPVGAFFGEDGLMAVQGDVSDIFMKHGYDGIIPDRAVNLDEVIVFDPTKIKSLDNTGAFDPLDPRIHASRDTVPKTTQTA